MASSPTPNPPAGTTVPEINETEEAIEVDDAVCGSLKTKHLLYARTKV